MYELMNVMHIKDLLEILNMMIKIFQGFNKKQYKSNLKKILLVNVTNEVYDILKEI